MCGLIMPRRVLLAQLPIPPFGIEPIRGNVPLAAAYLKMFAAAHGLERDFEIEILDPRLANLASERALVREILAREPFLVGFSCYLWNIQRTLWIARELKLRLPELRILLGGPEITLDNAWVLADPTVDYAAIGEGEQTFLELLTELRTHDKPTHPIAGLYVAPPLDQAAYRDLPPGGGNVFRELGPLPLARKPLPQLDPISSPYLTGILDAADERLLLLETIRGCIYNCKFCFYPKSYDDLYFVSREKILANLAHARERGATEVVILDPTLNQRGRFNEFLRELAACNPGHTFSYFGEIRAEGIMADTARLLREANFTEVEIGLQSIDPLAMELMDRNNNLKSFERAARAMLDQGIRVKVDLIIGLPGDTVDSVRRSLDYIHTSGLYTTVQVFNLAILPGTAFRHEAPELGLAFQDRPPYYVLETPTLTLSQMVELLDEAQELFAAEFDPLADAVTTRVQLDWSDEAPIPATQPEEVGLIGEITLDWPGENGSSLTSINLPPPERRSQALNLRLCGADLHEQRRWAAAAVERVLTENPHSTLQITLEPRGNPRTISPELLNDLQAACYREPSYLDRYYSVIPGPVKGAKRIVVAVEAEGDELASKPRDEQWLAAMEPYALVITRAEPLLKVPQ